MRLVIARHSLWKSVFWLGFALAGGFLAIFLAMSSEGTAKVLGVPAFVAVTVLLAFVSTRMIVRAIRRQPAFWIEAGRLHFKGIVPGSIPLEDVKTVTFDTWTLWDISLFGPAYGFYVIRTGRGSFAISFLFTEGKPAAVAETVTRAVTSARGIGRPPLTGGEAGD